MTNERIRVLPYQWPWGDFFKGPLCDCCEVLDSHEQCDAADVIVFHIPQLRGFPRRKPKGQFWAALSVESAVHYPLLAQRSELGGLFDIWMTYRRNADVWCPYLSPDYDVSLYDEPVEKTEPHPAVAFISSPYDRSDRLALMTELMRHMPIDSYGKVLQNRVPAKDEAAIGKRRTIFRYRFTMAFENAIESDYVTEKFFDPLIAGSVPVYLGAPNIDEYAPGDHCFINAKDYAGPNVLAAYLLELCSDADAYTRYFRWKSEPLRPSFLQMIKQIKVRPLCRLSKLVRCLRNGSADCDMLRGETEIVDE
jgi:hypothetical protein